MLTKSALSKIMLIKIKHGRKMKLTIPVAFIVFDEMLEIAEDWLWVFERLHPDWNKKLLKWKSDYVPLNDFSLGEAFELIQELFYELRKHRSFKLVEVDTKEIYVAVEFL